MRPPRRAHGPCSKKEIGTRVRPDRATARAEVFAFIETFYNRRLRKHKVFGYLTPAETRHRSQHGLAAQRSRVQNHGEASLGQVCPFGVEPEADPQVVSVALRMAR